MIDMISVTNILWNTMNKLSLISKNTKAQFENWQLWVSPLNLSKP